MLLKKRGLVKGGRLGGAYACALSGDTRQLPWRAGGNSESLYTKVPVGAAIKVGSGGAYFR